MFKYVSSTETSQKQSKEKQDPIGEVTLKFIDSHYSLQGLQSQIANRLNSLENRHHSDLEEIRQELSEQRVLIETLVNLLQKKEEEPWRVIVRYRLFDDFSLTFEHCSKTCSSVVQYSIWTIFRTDLKASFRNQRRTMKTTD